MSRFHLPTDSVNRSRVCQSGFSLIELAVTIAIVGLLATLVAMNYKGLMMKVSKANCISNMRSLHVSFSSYVNDVGCWPQVPEELASGESDYEGWWI